MARISVIEYWRDITGSDPNVIMTRYLYTAATDTYSTEVINIGGGGLSEFHPPAGTLLTYECDGMDLVEYFSTGAIGLVDITQTDNSPACCTLNAGDFNAVKTNQTSPTSPNGTIVITAPVLDIAEFEASIDDGDNYITQVDGAITFEDLPAGTYQIIIKTITGSCNVTLTIIIVDAIVYPPPIVTETTVPDLYSPVFFPITIGYKLSNNQIAIKQDVNGVYLEVDSQDERDYLGTLPIIKIFDNEDYEGKYKVNSVDDPLDPQKFYINATYVSDQNALFVPFDRQVFQLFAEVDFNNYRKIADISVYPDDTGEYLVRLEGFLQQVFKVLPPVNNGDEITLLRKYYVVPRDFEMEVSPTVLNALYSAVEDLSPFLLDLIPLGPAPINFINEQTQKGMPVLFSYIDTTTGRVKNVTSSYQTNIVQAGPLVYIPALPLNQYDLTWTNPAGTIVDLNISPVLPAWIVLVPGATDTVKLTIDTGLEVEGGDYDGSDYDGDDYLTGGPNTIVGCYEFEFFDGLTLLFTLNICVFPIQKSNPVCADDGFNIAWVNLQGGWSSYLFTGKKVFGKEIGDVKTYKSGKELKRSTVENVYDTVEVSFGNIAIKDAVFIASLKKSIQAYLYNNATLKWDIPIILDKQNFPVYQLPFKQIETADKFTFKYANEITVQSQ
jgi:hypothetical protein